MIRPVSPAYAAAAPAGPPAGLAAPLPVRAVFLVHPPYERADLHTSWSALEARHRVPGTIAGIRVEAKRPDWATLEPAVRSLRQRLPAAPVMLLLEESSAQGLPLTMRAARAGVRAVLSEGEPMREALRESLTQTDTLAQDVVEWLTLRGTRLSPTVSSLLLDIFALAPTSPDLTTLLARTGTAETSARFRLHKRRLPPPSRWFQTARALHLALRIQAEPQTGLLRIAHRFGYADHSALSQMIFRAFGVRPGAVRGTLGWEWLLDRSLGARLRSPGLAWRA